MKHLAALVAGLILAGAAQAHVASAPGSYTHRLQIRIAHDRGVVAAVDRQARTAGSAMFVEWRTWLTRQWHARDLAHAQAALARAQAAYLATLRPVHYYGWLCIHDGEGSWHDRDSGHNGHYGGLQMHPGWGYGTSYYASDDSPMQQMWAAERGLAANGLAWLYGQWAADFPRCSSFF